MLKAKSIISNLIDRNSQIENTIAIFRILQNQYKINLYIDNSFELFIVKIVAIFYYIVSSIFSRRLKEITKLLKIVYIQEQRITKKKKELLTI